MRDYLDFAHDFFAVLMTIAMAGLTAMAFMAGCFLP